MGIFEGANIHVFDNLFDGSDLVIMESPDSSEFTVENNVFDGANVDYVGGIHSRSAQNFIFRHNTITSATVSIGAYAGESAPSGGVFESNILRGPSTSFRATDGSGCASCTFQYNLVPDSRSSRGTKDVVGTPTFSGGPTPSTWSGWQLAAGLVGRNAAPDQKDIGVVFPSPLPVPPLATPSAVHH